MTSPSAGEGKTTTIANLAVALAQTGQRVVIVSCDLRRPRLHEFFGVPNGVGFTSVLLGEVPVSSATQPVEGTYGLRLVVSGPIPPTLQSCSPAGGRWRHWRRCRRRPTWC